MKIFELLFEKRTKVSLNDNLSNASKCGSEKILHFLLDKYVNAMDVEYKDEEGNTALHHVLELFDENEWKYQSFVKPLLSKGARLDAKNKEGKTPFDLLVEYVNDCFQWDAAFKPFKVISNRTVLALDLVVRLLSNHTDKGILEV